MRDYPAWRYHRDLPHFFRFHVRHLARVASEDEGLEREVNWFESNLFERDE